MIVIDVVFFTLIVLDEEYQFSMITIKIDVVATLPFKQRSQQWCFIDHQYRTLEGEIEK
jgi:hypothetical protein